jgi:hypothetical protein
MKHKVNMDNVDEKYKPLVKENMTTQEIQILGEIILKEKIQNLKNKLFGWYYKRKNKKNNKKKI